MPIERIATAQTVAHNFYKMPARRHDHFLSTETLEFPLWFQPATIGHPELIYSVISLLIFYRRVFGETTLIFVGKLRKYL
jgi:hypothetical protein